MRFKHANASSYFRLHTSVFILPSSRLDQNFLVRSQFYSDHRVHFIDLANSLPLDRWLFAFILCFYDQKSSKKQQCCENATNSVNYEVISTNDRRNLWSAQRECQTASRVAQRECQTAARVAAKRPTGCCWSSLFLCRTKVKSDHCKIQMQLLKFPNNFTITANRYICMHFFLIMLGQPVGCFDLVSVLTLINTLSMHTSPSIKSLHPPLHSTPL